MTDTTQPSLGTVAEEAARLISAMATMARSSSASDNPPKDSSPYAGGPAHEPRLQDEQSVPPAADEAGPERACSTCGGDRDGTPVACKLCPLCQGIALLRSVRPETVDRLADLASAVAASLRDMATQSRADSSASGSGSDARSGSGRSADRVRATVQDIPVDDETEG